MSLFLANRKRRNTSWVSCASNAKTWMTISGGMDAMVTISISKAER